MLKKTQDWQPPDDWLKIATVDCHTEGEPFRVITSDCPNLPGEPIVIESITGKHEFLIDPTDPLRDGFILR